ncbi:MAG TPA: glycosyltransferase family 4 protein [Puia sp.]|jgi:glycosyltransferase involved in cell wall biosynthesis|nr:glycosyltransferase family 4 protein [Puia sp.]
MRVVFITRATLYSVKGGDTLQVLETARHLQQMGIRVDIRLTNEKIDYDRYDLLHFFNIIRPADILFHIRQSRTPFVVSTLLIDYSGYDRQHRKGIAGALFKLFSSDAIEYLKTLARFVLGRDQLMSKAYLWKGQQRSVREILERASLLFSNSVMEYRKLVQLYQCSTGCIPIPNGMDAELFAFDEGQEKDDHLVLCVARIEGLKNQINLIRALNNTDYQLLIIGSPAPNQSSYYRECRRIAASNVHFIEHIPQRELVQYYQKAKVHILPSWFETCGLSSLEAGAMGCNIVITDKGYTREYYEDHAFYCDPGNPDSILRAVDYAAHTKSRPALRKKILTNYTWDQAAACIAQAYHQILDPL